MKKILLLAIILAGSMIIWSQVPQAMTYKAIAKDDWGVALPNKTITLRFTILEGSGTGSIAYQEIHTTTTNKFGLMDVEIGKGTPVTGSFDLIDWSSGIYYIQIEMDPNGGSNFRLEDPAHQLLSVPYALFAESSNFTETDPFFTSSPSSGIWNSDIFNWNTAFSWGNHANEGYLKSFSETDPIFLLHPAHIIASEDINNWNTAFDWGDHTGLYKPLTWMPAWNEITENPFLVSSPLANQVLKYNAVTERWENWSPDYLTAEVDGSVTNEIQTLSISGNTITLSDGGSVNLPNIAGMFYYADRDLDGYGDALSPIWLPSGVEPPAHFIPDNTDCNDNNPFINPGATETPDDLDNNCDGLIDNYQCTQFSSFPIVHSGEFSATVNQFCFNLPDIPSNGQCTINVEIGIAGPWVYIDAYADNTMVASNDGLLVFEVEQGLDYKVILKNTPHNDVLSFGPYTVTVSFETIDIDNDGYSVAEGDCNDNDASIYPGAPEIFDGKDNDCSGIVDEGFDFDHDGYATVTGDCNDHDPSIFPGAPEICGDGIDQDCDGKDPKCPENLIIDPSFENTSMNDWNASGVTYTTINPFDGYSSAMFAQTYCSISQDITIPAGASSLKINFWERNESYVSCPTNYLAIYVDDQLICMINPAAHDTWLNFSYDIPLSFSDGGTHTLSIDSSNDPSITPYYVDKVELIISY